jgi:hypothetical protein
MMLLAVSRAVALLANGASYDGAASSAGELTLAQYPPYDGAMQPCAFSAGIRPAGLDV